MTARTVQVEVTAKDIEHGEAGSCVECPVARALARALVPVEVEVAPLFLVIDGQRINSPDEVIGFVSLFDGGCQVAPFTFALRWDDAGGWAAA